VAFGVIAGLVLIHLGGLAQLAILTGNLSAAARFGTWPFLLGDLIKIAVLGAGLAAHSDIPAHLWRASLRQ